MDCYMICYPAKVWPEVAPPAIRVLILKTVFSPPSRIQQAEHRLRRKHLARE